MAPPVGQRPGPGLLVLPALPAPALARHTELRGRPRAAHPLSLHHLRHLGQPRLRPRVLPLVLDEAVVDVTLGAWNINSDVNFARVVTGGVILLDMLCTLLWGLTTGRKIDPWIRGSWNIQNMLSNASKCLNFPAVIRHGVYCQG